MRNRHGDSTLKNKSSNISFYICIVAGVIAVVALWRDAFNVLNGDLTQPATKSQVSRIMNDLIGCFISFAGVVFFIILAILNPSKVPKQKQDAEQDAASDGL